MDLDCSQPKVKEFIRKNLEFLAKHGAAFDPAGCIRLCDQEARNQLLFPGTGGLGPVKGNSGYDGAVWDQKRFRRLMRHILPS